MRSFFPLHDDLWASSARVCHEHLGSEPGNPKWRLKSPVSFPFLPFLMIVSLGYEYFRICIRASAPLSKVEDSADGGGPRNEGTDAVDDGEPGTTTLHVSSLLPLFMFAFPLPCTEEWMTVVLIGLRVFDRSWVGQGVYLSTRKMTNRPIFCRRGVLTIQSLLQVSRIGKKLRGAWLGMRVTLQNTLCAVS